MKVVLFCGGLGTRLREHSDTIPKPLSMSESDHLARCATTLTSGIRNLFSASGIAET